MERRHEGTTYVSTLKIQQLDLRDYEWVITTKDEVTGEVLAVQRPRAGKSYAGYEAALVDGKLALGDLVVRQPGPASSLAKKDAGDLR